MQLIVNFPHKKFMEYAFIKPDIPVNHCHLNSVQVQKSEYKNYQNITYNKIQCEKNLKHPEKLLVPYFFGHLYSIMLTKTRSKSL